MHALYVFLCSSNPAAVLRLQEGEDLASVLNDLDWEANSGLARSFQDSFIHNEIDGYCDIENVSLKNFCPHADIF